MAEQQVRAADAHARASRIKGRAVTGWLLDPGERSALLDRFAPTHPDTIAHHVTLTARTGPGAPLPCERDGEIVGIADDGVGVQALVVRIADTTDRPDGSTYHITWSLDRKAGRQARESNDVIRRHGWVPLADPVPLRLVPGFVN